MKEVTLKVDDQTIELMVSAIIEKSNEEFAYKFRAKNPSNIQRATVNEKKLDDVLAQLLEIKQKKVDIPIEGSRLAGQFVESTLGT